MAKTVVVVISCSVFVLIGTPAIWLRVAIAQPNIVWIVSDDAGYNDFGFMADLYGNSTDVQTPNLDALAAHSRVMLEGYVCAAICSPSRVSMLTGQYAQRFGYEDNPSNQAGNTQGLPAGHQLISHHLRSLGYTTGAIGKWHLGEVDGVNRPLDMAFDEFYGFFGGGRPFWQGYGDSQRAIRRGDVSIETLWGSEGDTSRYDPANGRYLTDAFGEEAVGFINRHAAEEAPFFLYVGVNAPHSPLQAKQSDLDMFPDITDPNRKLVAAMTYGLDRAVGDIVDAISANGIDDETIIVFMNDNGGTANPPAHNNYPLWGYKGGMWEGGIRVPMIIKAPGLAPGVYDQPVTSIDLVPTFVNAAGGDSTNIETDGVDLLPFLEGEIAGSPHEVMFWRGADGRYAVRKGKWKLMLPSASTSSRLSDLEYGEPDTFYSSQPQIVADLARELTFWEATIKKPMWGPLGDDMFNQFDHFVYRTDIPATSNWSTDGNWTQAGTSANAKLMNQDAYANAVLEFGVRNDGSYVANNDMTRSTKYTFMLNELRFTGDYAGADDASGTITGNPLLLVNNLLGQPATIRNETTSTSNSQFSFNINVELQLLNDLVFDGDGTQPIVVSGTIRDYYESRGVIKTGNSAVALAGNNLFTGTLNIQNGRLSAANLAGDLQVEGGSFGVMGATHVSGNYTQSGGVLEIQLGESSSQLVIDGSADLGGLGPCKNSCVS
jgi:autotransporter-associated beta strand protein